MIFSEYRFIVDGKEQQAHSGREARCLRASGNRPWGLMTPIDVSIVVPTRNRVQSLARLLRSLDLMEIPDALRTEALFADNGSTDETGRFLLEEQKKPRKFLLRVLQEMRRGKANAVNRCLQESEGKIISIIDDDVVVHPQWLVRHLECYDLAAFDALQGRILPGVDPEGRPADLERLYQYNIPLVDYGNQIREIKGLLATNISLKREVFEKAGFYNPSLGAGASGFGEDTEYSARIRKAGFKIGYTPHAVVYHELDPGRYGRAYNRRIHYLKGFSRSLSRRDSIPFRVVPNLLASCIRYGLYRTSGQGEKAYKTEGRIMRYWGYLIGKAGSCLRRDSGQSD